MLNIQTKTLSRLAVLLVALGFTCMAFAQVSTDSTETLALSIGYYTGANEGLPDAQLHVVNPGSTGGFGNRDESQGSTPYGGDLCANVYVFTPDEQMIACCSCKVSPNGMQGFSLASDLVGNPLTSTLPHAGAIKIVASLGGGPPAGLGQPPTSVATNNSGRVCDAGSFYPIGGALESWITHVRTLTSSVAVTEVPFDVAPLSWSEAYKLVTQCFTIEASPSRGGTGSGAGLCNCDPNKAF